MERRSFLKNTAMASFALLFDPFTSAAKSIYPIKKHNFPVWKDIIDYARWTASPHNIQPWKIKIISEKEAELFYDPQRLLPDTDPQGCFVTVGMSMFVENLSIASGFYGCEVTAEYYGKIESKNSGLTSYARLMIRESSKINKIDRQLIKARRTSRLNYKYGAIDHKILEELKAKVKEENHEFNYSNESEMIEWVKEINTKTLFSDLDNESARNEIEKWLRYTDEEANICKDGLWSKCMGFPGWLMKDFFQRHTHYDHGLKKSLLEKIHHRTMRGTNNIGWFSGKFETQEDWIRAGKILAGFWLSLTEHNIYMHPFGSVITNQKSHAGLSEKINLNENGIKLWFLFRMGYSDVPARSYRLDLKDILLT